MGRVGVAPAIPIVVGIKKLGNHSSDTAPPCRSTLFLNAKILPFLESMSINETLTYVI